MLSFHLFSQNLPRRKPSKVWFVVIQCFTNIPQYLFTCKTYYNRCTSSTSIEKDNNISSTGVHAKTLSKTHYVRFRMCLIGLQFPLQCGHIFPLSLPLSNVFILFTFHFLHYNGNGMLFTAVPNSTRWLLFLSCIQGVTKLGS